ncbi:hypothetical protein CDAR_523991 [Caerostris darwini]|uniref:Uncharacterized protein n=1 Tax=Caerostris darwini TaxID=1538125 RepID=A0AAV4TSQ1_9ARAC|nr:hypothetical protein CDAR_523991 [Caerostris darwini]
MGFVTSIKACLGKLPGVAPGVGEGSNPTKDHSYLQIVHAHFPAKICSLFCDNCDVINLLCAFLTRTKQS